MAYLIDKGADVNAVNLYGDSPLERASANHRRDVVQVLAAHGGKDLKGNAEQRDRASKEIVHRDIEEMNSGLRAIADALDARKLDGKSSARVRQQVDDTMTDYTFASC